MRRRTLRQLKQAVAPVHHHRVYVVLLDSRVAKLPRTRRLNPRRNPALPCVYVGMTGLTVEERFQNHCAGIRSAGVVKRFGLRLLPELYQYLGAMPYEAALQMEKELAEELRAKGYTVLGGH